jgi:UDP-N-acetylmuramyl pentapeptide phosphotransferase/UDP-N-acetylglucosamine-1-phosphate transferase
MLLTTTVVAAAAACLATGVLVALLPRWGVVDVPNHRSSHARPVPRGGGLGVIAGAAIGLAVGHPDELLAIGLVGALVLAVVGFTDDLRSLSAARRLSVQLLVSAAATLLLVRAHEVTAIQGMAVVALGTLWLSGYVNVFNFMDGSNGLAALNAAVAGACYAGVGAAEDVHSLMIGGGLLLGACLGFLPWNFPRARIFLGDVGSYSIGFTVAWLALVGILTTDRLLWCVAPTVLVLLDTSLTLVRRARRRESLTAAHREHVYQRLTTVPGSPVPALVATAVGVGIVAAATLPATWCLLCWVLLGAAYVAAPRLTALRQPARR